MFENMSYEDFQAAIKPKVNGSWNLHKILPTDMNFFILLSSATGILGNRSQANYAAGNTYQDSLARYRVSKGLPAASIDLGHILSVGYVAENKERLTAMSIITSVLDSLKEVEIHSLIEYYLDPRHSISENSCQLVSGLTSAAAYRQKGIPPPTYLNYPLFTHLNSVSNSARHSVEENPSLAVHVLLSSATTMETAATVVSDSIRHKLSKLLSISIDDIDPNKSISSNGVDSLIAMEFRSWLAKDLRADIPLLDIMGTSSISSLSQKSA